MNNNRSQALIWCLRFYLVLAFAFVFAPIIASMVFSFNSDRFPTIPLGEFSLQWYAQIWQNEAIWEAMQNSAVVAISVSVLSTFIGFCTAYTDYRYQFFGKNLPRIKFTVIVRVFKNQNSVLACVLPAGI